MLHIFVIAAKICANVMMWEIALSRNFAIKKLLTGCQQ